MTTRKLIRSYPKPPGPLPVNGRGQEVLDELVAQGWDLYVAYTVVPMPGRSVEWVTCNNICERRGNWPQTWRICGRNREFPIDLGTRAKETRGGLACPDCVITFANHEYYGVTNARWRAKLATWRKEAIQQEAIRFGYGNEAAY